MIGLHFMNPVPIMTLVELILGKYTSDETIDKTKYLRRFGCLAYFKPYRCPISMTADMRNSVLLPKRLRGLHLPMMKVNTLMRSGT